MDNLLQFIEQTSSSQNLDDLFRIFTQTACEIGYDRALFSLMTDHADLKLKAGHGIMKNYPDSWMQHYVEHGMEKYDPVRCFTFRASGPYLWDDLPRWIYYSDQQHKVMNGAREAGLHSGVGISMRNARGEIGGVGAANSTRDKLDPQAPYMLHMYSQHLYFKFSELQRPDDQVEKTPINDREREILNWIAVGKNIPEVATIVGLSKRGTKYHMRSILDKLSVPNQQAAVAKAFCAGLISP